MFQLGHYWFVGWEKMLSVDGERLCAGFISCNYIKRVQNLEKYVIDFSCWVKNLGSPDDHVQHGKNKKKVE